MPLPLAELRGFDAVHRRAQPLGVRRGPPAGRDQRAGARRRGARSRRHDLQAAIALRGEARRRPARGAQHRARTSRNAFADQPREWRPLVYCWRGGGRSGALVHVLRQVGWDARRLDGGYKAFRRQVVADLETLPRRIPFQRDLRGDRLGQEPPPRGARRERARRCSTSRCSRPIAARCWASCPTRRSRRRRSSRRRSGPRSRASTRAPGLRGIGEQEGRQPARARRAHRRACAASVRAARGDRRARVDLLLEDYAHFVARPERARRASSTASRPCTAPERIDAWKAHLAERGDGTTLVRDLLEEPLRPRLPALDSNATTSGCRTRASSGPAPCRWKTSRQRRRRSRACRWTRNSPSRKARTTAR